MVRALSAARKLISRPRGRWPDLLAFAFARIFAEPVIQAAIDYESARDEAKAALAAARAARRGRGAGHLQPDDPGQHRRRCRHRRVRDRHRAVLRGRLLHGLRPHRRRATAAAVAAGGLVAGSSPCS